MPVRSPTGRRSTSSPETTLPRIGTALVPTDEEERTLLKTRLIHAGLYSRQAMAVFLGVKSS